jgi:hypothetical protein
MNPEEFDFDLFFVCCGFSPALIHIATAGGFINRRIYTNPDHAKIRARLRDPSNVEKFDYRLNPNLDEILFQNASNSGMDRGTYLVDFVEYAKSGCFSFDRTYISESNNFLYHLVAYPVITENYLSAVNAATNSNIGNFGFIMSNNELENFIKLELRKPIDLERLLS